MGGGLGVHFFEEGLDGAVEVDGEAHEDFVVFVVFVVFALFVLFALGFGLVLGHCLEHGVGGGYFGGGGLRRVLVFVVCVGYGLGVGVGLGHILVFVGHGHGHGGHSGIDAGVGLFLEGDGVGDRLVDDVIYVVMEWLGDSVYVVVPFDHIGRLSEEIAIGGVDCGLPVLAIFFDEGCCDGGMAMDIA